MTEEERRARTWPYPQRWMVCGEEYFSFFRDYSFLYSFEDTGVWVYIELSNPLPGDNRPYGNGGDFWYFTRRQAGLDFLKRKIKELCHGAVYRVPSAPGDSLG